MKPATFLSLYSKLEKLVHRLPSALQQPILREITPIKTLFLLQRAPRLVLLGAETGKMELVNALFGGEVLRPSEESWRDGGWQEIGRPGRGTLKLLDARRPASLHMLRAALTAEPPDLFLFLGSGTALEVDRTQAEEVIAFANAQHEAKAKILAVLTSAEDGDRSRQDLHASLHARELLSERLAGTHAITEGPEIERIVQTIALELPGEAQLEMAQLSGNRGLQAQIAQVLIKSTTAICAAIGTQPIPLADFPILTGLQGTMVAGIMHISGREWSPKLIAEFTAAFGANLGAGLVLREGARAAVKFVPIWGNAISGAVAGAGTYAVGRAASAYFIEGVSLTDARQIFRRRKEKPLLKDR
jgi:uncharacterized protein (DUF697 family)